MSGRRGGEAREKEKGERAKRTKRGKREKEREREERRGAGAPDVGLGDDDIVRSAVGVELLVPLLDELVFNARPVALLDT